MPNFTSVLTDLASSAITSKLTKQNNKDSSKQPAGSTLDSVLTHISSSFGKTKETAVQDSNMSGYPPNQGYNPGGYPPAGGQGGPGQGGYPPSGQPAYPHSSQGGYPPANQPGYSPPGQGDYPNQGGYPPQNQGGYPPSSNPNQSSYGNPYPGYPPSQPNQQPAYGGASTGIGFNVSEGGGYGGQQPPQAQPYQGYPPAHSGGAAGAYQPNTSGGGYGGGYPPAGQPAYNSSSVYPTQAVDSVQHLYNTQPPPANQPQHQGNHPGASMQNPTQSTPTVKPNPNFNAGHSAELLRKAMKGFGCNKDKVVQALCTISNWQRQEVAKAFKVQYGKDLISELKKELSGDFEDLVLALMEPPARYDAQQLHKAMAGLGTKESVLIEIMTTRSNAQIQELKYTYKQLYNTDLEKDLVGETSGHFKRLLISLCCGARDEGTYRVDPLRANQDARALYRAGEQRLGTDESTFNSILAAQNFAQLRLVFQEYQTVSKHSIEQAITSEFSGDIRDGLLAIVKSIRSRPGYFAELIHNSMVGLGTRDNDLIRLIVTRSEIDLADIRNIYPQLYKTTLEKAIAGDCSGAYKEGLITLVKGN